MRKVIITAAALLALVGFSAGAEAQTQMNKSALIAQNNSSITTNGQGQITGALLNSLLGNMIASSCTILDTANCPVTSISGLGTGVATALAIAPGTTGGFVTFPLNLTGATGLVRASISDWGTNVQSALGHTLDAASGLVGYSQLAADVYATTSMSVSVQSAIQNATNAANGLAQLNASAQVVGPFALSNLLDSATAPTFTSGACGGAIGTTNGTAAFTFTTGSTSCSSTATIGLPAAAHGWICSAIDEASAGLFQIQETSDTTTSVVFTDFSIGSTPTATNFTASHTIKVACAAY